MSHTRLSPVCQKPMITQYNQGLEYEVCPETGGIWFDFGELKTVIDLDPDKRFGHTTIKRGDDVPDHNQVLMCPDRKYKLEQREYAYDSGIHIDFCKETGGVFVSPQDLAEIKRFLSSSRNSVEAKALQAKAVQAMHKIYTEHHEKQALETRSIDNLFYLDDLPFVNRVAEWLISEMFDVDSFERANK